VIPDPQLLAVAVVRRRGPLDDFHAPAERWGSALRRLGSRFIGIPPAVNTVCDALDIDHFDMPLTPEAVWKAKRSAGTGGEGLRRIFEARGDVNAAHIQAVRLSVLRETALNVREG
jgi:hypothetical protein